MIYYEMTKSWQSNIHNIRRSKTCPPGIYYASIYYGDDFHGSVLDQANRVWTEIDEEIKCVIPKNADIDLKEIAWIKLKAKPLEDFR